MFMIVNRKASWIARLIRVAIGCLLLVWLILISMPRWLSADTINQSLAASALTPAGIPIRVSGVRWRWGFRPGVIITGAAIGQRAMAETVELVFGWSLLIGELSVHKLELVDLQVNGPEWQTWWKQRPASKASSEFNGLPATLVLRNVQIAPWSKQLGELSGVVEFAEGGQLTQAKLMLGNLALEVSTGDNGYALSAFAAHWQPVSGFELTGVAASGNWQPELDNRPNKVALTVTTDFGRFPGLNTVFGDLSLEAELVGDQIAINSFQGRLFEGMITGFGEGVLTPKLQLSMDWQLSEVNLVAVVSAQQLEPFAGLLSASGVFELTQPADDQVNRPGSQRQLIENEEAQVGVDWRAHGTAGIESLKLATTGLEFADVEGTFELNQSGLHLRQVQISGYDGTTTTDLNIDWRHGLLITGNALINQVKLEPLVSDLQFNPLRGRLDAELEFNWRSGNQAALSGLQLNGAWQLDHGFFPGFDLGAARKLMSQSKGPQSGTAFDQAMSKISVDGGKVMLTEIEIRSAALAAYGDVEIAADGSLKGTLQVGGNEATGLSRLAVNIDGTIKQPELLPTKSSLVGGAVGSVLLGPGLGTAVGVKVGEGLNTLKEKLFGGGK